jgi:hypothetical protein
MTLQKLAQDAINVQDTCNMSGVVRGFNEALTQLREILQNDKQFGSDVIAKHPITRMWASKIHDLAGMGLSDMDRYSEAYAACRKIAGIE